MLVSRCEAKVGGIDSFEFGSIGANGELEGYVTGPKGRIHLQCIYAGGYNIQCLHIRFLMSKLKGSK